MSQLLRDYEITVGSAAEVFAGKPEQLKKSSTATVITNLQFDGSVSVSNDHTTTSNDNTQFKFVNLSNEIKEQLRVEGAAMMIRAGYTDASVRDVSGEIVRKPDELPVVFVGTILHTFTTRRGNDMVTQVYASSDKLERAYIKTSHSFPPNTEVAAVINYLLNQIDMPQEHVDLSSVANKRYSGGLAIYGKSMEQLQRICNEWNLRFFVHDKKLNIVPLQPNRASKVEVWDIYPNHVIDAPEEIYERSQTKDTTPSGKQKKKPSELKAGETQEVEDGKRTIIKHGLNITLHLDGRIKVGSHVRINEMDTKNGVYRVEKLTHTMSFIGGSWTTQLEMIPV